VLLKLAASKNLLLNVADFDDNWARFLKSTFSSVFA